MKGKLIYLIAILLCSPFGQAMACSFCYGAKDGKETQHMAVAIWFLFSAIMTVLGGIGAFSYSIWKHSKMPLAPHQQLAQEDLEQYE